MPEKDIKNHLDDINWEWTKCSVCKNQAIGKSLKRLSVSHKKTPTHLNFQKKLKGYEEPRRRMVYMLSNTGGVLTP
jgi:hypothetical protein